MKRTIFLILGIIATIIVCFIIGLQLSKVFLESNIEEIETVQEKEDSKNHSSKENEANSMENKVIESKTNKKDSFVGIIAEIDINNKQILVENSSHLVIQEIYKSDREWRNNHRVIIDGETYVKAGYLLVLDNVTIKESNGNKIEIHDLKIGDTINVSTKNIEYSNKTIFEPLTSDNIVLIERK